MDDLTDAIEQVYFWQYSRTESFMDHLFDLWMHADMGNKDRLASAFPVEIRALEEWYYSVDPIEFFKQNLRKELLARLLREYHGDNK